jgi:hypothetical protein
MLTTESLLPYFKSQHGFCYPDWSQIGELIKSRLPENEWNDAWLVAARSWCAQMVQHLGEGYQVSETDNFLIVTDSPTRIVRKMNKAYEASLKRILSSLDGVMEDEGYGKHVAFIFSEVETYYQYISHFYPDGEHAMSGGICLNSEGYTHFAFPAADYSSYHTVLVHELTHACLNHLPIPTWLNEALAMRMEEVVCGTEVFYLDQEIYEKHLNYWNGKTIQEFWSGESWNIAGDSNELSYSLAQIIWRKIEADLSATEYEIKRFVLSANFEDGGEAACQKVFELGLGDLVSDFLGEGNWSPQTPPPEPVS